MRRVGAAYSGRTGEAMLLGLVSLAGFLGFTLLSVGLQVRRGLNPLDGLPAALLPVVVVAGCSVAIHLLLLARQRTTEQLILPLVSLLVMLGLLIIWRLRGPQGAWQQLGRGLIPGMFIVAGLVLRPGWLETLRRWAIPFSLGGLLLPILTAFFGVVDETGARLALRLGPLPPIQPSEVIKLALIVFLAWFIDREGRVVEGRGKPFLGWLRLPPLHYFWPGLLYVSLTTLALVQMADFGAVLILSLLFVAMLFAGLETRSFITIAAMGLTLALSVGLALAFTWEIPTVIRYRFLAFQNPWSQAVVMQDGQSAGMTISEGPGYQIQQSIYALMAGGISGSGLGFGSPEYVPLAHSDFIFAALVEEMGSLTGLAVLLLFGVLLLRIARIALLLPAGQVFERLLLAGIAIHLFMQVFVMVGGTLNLLPLTGVTIPFMSQGGVALGVNLAEMGLVLAAAQRLEASGE